MLQFKRFSQPILLAAVVALFATISALASAPRETHASGPEDVVNSFAAAINRHDAAGAAAMFTPDGFFSVVDDGSFGAVGQDALVSAFNPDDLPTSVELTEVSVHGDTVEAVGRIVDDRSAAAGIVRYLQPITAVIRDNKIAELHLSLDLTDAQTRTYLAYEQSQDGGEDDGPPPATVELPMTDVGSGAPAGTAFIYEFDGQSGVAIQDAPGAAAVVQSAVILVGDCPHGSAIASPLAYVVDGSSFTLTSLTKSQLLAGDYAIAVENINLGAGRYASCGEVEAATAVSEPESPSAPETPPAPKPPAPSGVITAPSTGTGSGSAAEGAGTMWLLAALAFGGAVLVGSGAFLKVGRRS